MVTALRVLVTKDEKQEHEYESHGAFQVSEPKTIIFNSCALVPNMGRRAQMGM